VLINWWSGLDLFTCARERSGRGYMSACVLYICYQGKKDAS
jgi:hypothetical protein